MGDHESQFLCHFILVRYVWLNLYPQPIGPCRVVSCRAAAASEQEATCVLSRAIEATAVVRSGDLQTKTLR